MLFLGLRFDWEKSAKLFVEGRPDPQVTHVILGATSYLG